MARELVAVSIYLPPAAKAEADARAARKVIPTATLLRSILLGDEPPLKSPIDPQTERLKTMAR